MLVARLAGDGQGALEDFTQRNLAQQLYNAAQQEFQQVGEEGNGIQGEVNLNCTSQQATPTACPATACQQQHCPVLAKSDRVQDISPSVEGLLYGSCSSLSKSSSQACAGAHELDLKTLCSHCCIHDSREQQEDAAAAGGAFDMLISSNTNERHVTAVTTATATTALQQKQQGTRSSNVAAGATATVEVVYTCESYGKGSCSGKRSSSTSSTSSKLSEDQSTVCGAKPAAVAVVPLPANIFQEQQHQLPMLSELQSTAAATLAEQQRQQQEPPVPQRSESNCSSGSIKVCSGSNTHTSSSSLSCNSNSSSAASASRTGGSTAAAGSSSHGGGGNSSGGDDDEKRNNTYQITHGCAAAAVDSNTAAATTDRGSSSSLEQASTTAASTAAEAIGAAVGCSTSDPVVEPAHTAPGCNQPRGLLRLSGPLSGPSTFDYAPHCAPHSFIFPPNSNQSTTEAHTDAVRPSLMGDQAGAVPASLPGYSQGLMVQYAGLLGQPMTPPAGYGSSAAAWFHGSAASAQRRLGESAGFGGLCPGHGWGCGSSAAQQQHRQQECGIQLQGLEACASTVAEEQQSQTALPSVQPAAAATAGTTRSPLLLSPAASQGPLDTLGGGSSSSAVMPLNPQRAPSVAHLSNHLHQLNPGLMGLISSSEPSLATLAGQHSGSDHLITWLSNDDVTRGGASTGGLSCPGAVTSSSVALVAGIESALPTSEQITDAAAGCQEQTADQLDTLKPTSDAASEAEQQKLQEHESDGSSAACTAASKQQQTEQTAAEAGGDVAVLQGSAAAAGDELAATEDVSAATAGAAMRRAASGSTGSMSRVGSLASAGASIAYTYSGDSLEDLEAMRSSSASFAAALAEAEAIAADVEACTLGRDKQEITATEATEDAQAQKDQNEPELQAGALAAEAAIRPASGCVYDPAELTKGPPSRHLWLGNLHQRLPRSVLRGVFERYGPVDDVVTFPGRMYAFVNFKDVADAARAAEAVQDKEVPALSGNRKLVVKFRSSRRALGKDAEAMVPGLIELTRNGSSSSRSGSKSSSNAGSSSNLKAAAQSSSIGTAGTAAAGGASLGVTASRSSSSSSLAWLAAAAASVRCAQPDNSAPTAPKLSAPDGTAADTHNSTCVTETAAVLEATAALQRAAPLAATDSLQPKQQLLLPPGLAAAAAATADAGAATTEAVLDTAAELDQHQQPTSSSAAAMAAVAAATGGSSDMSSVAAVVAAAAAAVASSSADSNAATAAHVAAAAAALAAVDAGLPQGAPGSGWQASGTDEADIPEGKPSRHLWLGNIPLKPNRAAMEALFTRYGPLESVRVFPGKTFAFVNYVHAAHAIEAKAALDAQPSPHITGPKPLVIRFQKDTASVPPVNASARALDAAAAASRVRTCPLSRTSLPGCLLGATAAGSLAPLGEGEAVPEPAVNLSNKLNPNNIHYDRELAARYKRMTKTEKEALWTQDRAMQQLEQNPAAAALLSAAAAAAAGQHTPASLLDSTLHQHQGGAAAAAAAAAATSYYGQLMAATPQLAAAATALTQARMRVAAADASSGLFQQASLHQGSSWNSPAAAVMAAAAYQQAAVAAAALQAQGSGAGSTAAAAVAAANSAGLDQLLSGYGGFGSAAAAAGGGGGQLGGVTGLQQYLAAAGGAYGHNTLLGQTNQALLHQISSSCNLTGQQQGHQLAAAVGAGQLPNSHDATLAGLGLTPAMLFPLQGTSQLAAGLTHYNASGMGLGQNAAAAAGISSVLAGAAVGGLGTVSALHQAANAVPGTPITQTAHRIAAVESWEQSKMAEVEIADNGSRGGAMPYQHAASMTGAESFLPPLKHSSGSNALGPIGPMSASGATNREAIASAFGSQQLYGQQQQPQQQSSRQGWDSAPARGSSGLGHQWPLHMLCPLTGQVMSDPVVAADGHTYERSAVTEWLKMRDTSPVTGQKMLSAVVQPNHQMRQAIAAVLMGIQGNMGLT